MKKKLDIINFFTREDNFVLSSHVNPDGDSLGSTLALYYSLKKLGKNVSVLKPDEIPKKLMFIPGLENLKEKKDIENLEIKKHIFISLDCADLSRLGENKRFALEFNKLLNIDHHVTNKLYGDYNIVDIESSSTGEIIYEIINKLNIEIDSRIANLLYLAISSDTGSFMYSNTTAKTHSIASKLYEYGTSFDKININLYQNKSIETIRLFNLVLSNMETYFDNKLAIAYIDKRMLESAGADINDSEGMVEELRNIEGIELSILLKEVDNSIKISMRSKEYMDVSKLCKKFSGGGHKRAAGANVSNINIKNLKKLILEEVENDI